LVVLRGPAVLVVLGVLALVVLGHRRCLLGSWIRAGVCGQARCFSGVGLLEASTPSPVVLLVDLTAGVALVEDPARRGQPGGRGRLVRLVRRRLVHRRWRA